MIIGKRTIYIYEKLYLLLIYDCKVSVRFNAIIPKIGSLSDLTHDNNCEIEH